jgi:phosphate transport system substrate-binding protein
VLKAVAAGSETHDPLGPMPTPAPVETTGLSRARKRRPLVPAWLVLLALASAGSGFAIWRLSGPNDSNRTKHPDGPLHRTEPGPTPPAPVVSSVTGEGSSFVDPVMQRWAEVYKQTRSVPVVYVKSGSTTGVRELISRRVMFAGTDAFLTDQQMLEAEAAGGPVVHVPLVMGAVVATYNLPDVKQPLRFPGKVLADIYLGKIKNWNDPVIRSNNPGVKLPDLPIIVVRRSDGSGTTFIWTDYLSKVSGEWKAGPGVGNSVKWPVGVGAEKNDGMAREVSKTLGAIGYVELTFTQARGLPAALIENREGEFVAPSLESVTAAATNKLKDIPPDLRYTLTDVPGKESYPISGTTWAVVFKKTLAEDRFLREFLHWTVHDGQRYVTELKYAPLPSELVSKIDAILDAVSSGQ